MKTADERITHYNNRMQSSQIDPVLAAVSDSAKANFAAYANEFVPLQEQLRNLLDAAGIPTTGYFKYEAFNGEMYHLWLTSAGDSAVATASALVAKYIAFGAVEQTLIDIAANLYNIVVPLIVP